MYKKILASNKNILVCPLDWGIGHATRCVPIIQNLIDQKVNVIIAAANRPLAFLKQELPQLQFIEFPGYDISYPKKGSMALKMFNSIPAIRRGIRKEHAFLQNIIQKHNIHAVISDNRFGLWSDKIPSIYMSHQIYIKAPGLLKITEPFLFKMHSYYYKKFDECWIPDYEGSKNLSGNLSHKGESSENMYFIGPLSRFNDFGNEPDSDYQVLAIVSGPEPQRTIFQEKLISHLKNIKKKTLLLKGTPESQSIETFNDFLTIRSHLDSPALQKIIMGVDIVISRPGYSTIMDLALSGKKVIFIPTPGQTEQEYLADYHASKNRCLSIKQKNMELSSAFKKLKQCDDFRISFTCTTLNDRIEALMESIH